MIAFSFHGVAKGPLLRFGWSLTRRCGRSPPFAIAICHSRWTQTLLRRQARRRPRLDGAAPQHRRCTRASPRSHRPSPYRRAAPQRRCVLRPSNSSASSTLRSPLRPSRAPRCLFRCGSPLAWATSLPRKIMTLRQTRAAAIQAADRRQARAESVARSSSHQPARLRRRQVCRRARRAGWLGSGGRRRSRPQTTHERRITPRCRSPPTPWLVSRPRVIILSSSP